MVVTVVTLIDITTTVNLTVTMTLTAAIKMTMIIKTVTRTVVYIAMTVTLSTYIYRTPLYYLIR